MPTNLPPKYFDVEKKLKTAVEPEEKVKIMEELISIIPKHKGTEKLLALYKTKIAKMRSAAQKKAATAKHGAGHNVKKTGSGQVVLVGPPNTGKSLLVKALTDIDMQVGEYPFTTHEACPAMMKYKDIQIQLVDTPPITPDFMEIWYPDLIKGCDGVIILLDPCGMDPVDRLLALLDRLRQKKIEFVMDESPAVSQGGWVYKKALMAANKSDLPDCTENLGIVKELLDTDFHWIPVSAATGEGLEELKTHIYSMLGIIRVYSKIPGKKADMNDPFTLPKGSTVMDMARTVHKDFSDKMAFARIWGKTSYDGQRVNRDHVLEEEDIIELHKG